MKAKEKYRANGRVGQRQMREKRKRYSTTEIRGSEDGQKMEEHPHQGAMFFMRLSLSKVFEDFNDMILLHLGRQFDEPMHDEKY